VLAAVLAVAMPWASSLAVADNASRIQPYSENPFFWQYQGEPALLLGGSRQDNLFNNPEGLEEHLDRIAAAGGNYVRNTMSDRNPENRYAFSEVDDGLYDLDQWDEKYWVRFDSFLRMCYERDIIVQIEVWDPWDLFASEAPLGYGPRNTGWESHPYNPLNNVNYTAEESGLAEEIDYFSGSTPSDHAFFHTVPAMDDNKVVRRYQEVFVNRMLDFSLDYPNVLYCMNNEIGEDPEWGRYWACLIRDRAEAEGVNVYLADMRRNSNFNSQEQIDLLHDDKHYDFFEISQNNANTGQNHFDQILTVRERRLDDPKPLNNVKIYGGEGHGWTGGEAEAPRRMWRNILGGCASSRFHRPGPDDAPFGIGARDLALDHISSVRALMEDVGWPNLEPDLAFAELAVERDVAVRTEKTHVAYTRNADGQARLYIDGEEAVSGKIRGDMSPWDTEMRLALGDEFVGERGWLGAFHGVAIYNRALDASEIADHYAAGAPEHLDGLQARYAFDEGRGAVVHDVSGQEQALDMQIEDTGAVSWSDDGLELTDSVLVATEEPAKRLAAAMQNTNAITVEAWLTPAAEIQSGPARIVTLSQDHVNRNFTLGQEEDAYEMRLRTTETSDNGLPSLIAGPDAEASIAAARSPEGDRAVIFVSHGALIAVDMEQLEKNLAAEWHEPRTAERQDAKPNQDGYFQPPTRGDWVLVLQ
ncbi:MAG: LamG-like jellyroll fold domain-containing protein, partial [Planctomycetota bacterium]